MLIVKDIQDAITVKNKLASVLRRSNTFNMSKSDIQVELDMIIGDLINNIAREEKALDVHMDELFLQDSDGYTTLGGQV
jgi:hypothetical protein